MKKFIFPLLIGASFINGYAQNMNCNASECTEPLKMINECGAKAPPKMIDECGVYKNLYTLRGSVGGNYTYMKLSPDGVDSSTGSLGGVQASLEFLPRKFLYEGITFLWRTGTLDSSQGRSTDIEDFDTQIRLGFVNTTFNRLRITGFSGFGWRYISQLLKSPGVSDLALNYNEVYIPVGAMFDYRIYDCFSFGFNGTWMPEIYSTVNFVPLDNGRWITDCKLANFQVEFPLTYYFNYNQVSFTFEGKPFFQFWQDGKTLAETTTGLDLGLPQNSYYLGGITLSIGAYF